MSTIQVYKTPKLDSNNTQVEEFNKHGQTNSTLCAYDMIGLGWIMEDVSLD